MAQFAEEVEFEVLLVRLSTVCPAPEVPNIRTKSSRELVELRVGPCGTTVLVRGGWWSGRKGWVKGVSLAGTGVWHLPASGAALCTCWSTVGSAGAHCYTWLASSLAAFFCTFCAAGGFLLLFLLLLLSFKSALHLREPKTLILQIILVERLNEIFVL